MWSNFYLAIFRCGLFVWADDTLDLQLCGGINELAVSKIHQQAMVVEKVSTQDRLWEVSDEKNEQKVVCE
jgi:hypothetical protein